MGSFVREHIKKRQTIDKGSTQDKGTLTVKKLHEQNYTVFFRNETLH